VRFEAVKLNDEVVYYKAYDKDDRIVGVAFKANAKGYASNIETLAGMDQQGAITAIKIISQNETPGLGARIEERDFTSQFANRDLKGLAEVQAITGATISSKAVIDSVKQKAQEVKELLKSAK
jgi:electron transport complex protein RnfG